MMRILAGVTATLLLAGCSGAGVGDGGNASTAPGAPVLFWAPQAGMAFAFTWSDTTGETQYRLLEDPDSRSGYAQVATLPADVTGHTLQGLPLLRRLNARYILRACNGAGCTDSAPVHINGNLATAVASVTGSNTEAGDELGYSLALSEDGRTLVVAASGEDSRATGIDGDQDDNSASGSGAVYVFVRGDGGGWSQQAYLKASNTEANDYFGASVALSGDGNTLAVGAWAEDGNATGVNASQGDNSSASSGAVYVFARSGSIWSQQAYLKASNAAASDGFGNGLALSGDGNTLAAGAPREDSRAAGIDGDQDDNSAPDSGAVYVFARSGSRWNQQAYVKASNTGSDDNFGHRVALSGDGATLAVGAWQEDGGATGVDGPQDSDGAADSGAAYVFIRNGSLWSQQAYLKASNAEAADNFGHSIAISTDGGTLAVGAWREASRAEGMNDPAQADNTVGTAGAAYVFTRGAGTWNQLTYVKTPERGISSWFGRSVELSGNGITLAVGAAGGGGGKVYLY